MHSSVFRDKPFICSGQTNCQRLQRLWKKRSGSLALTAILKRQPVPLVDLRGNKLQRLGPLLRHRKIVSSFRDNIFSFNCSSVCSVEKISPELVLINPGTSDPRAPFFMSPPSSSTSEDAVAHTPPYKCRIGQLKMINNAVLSGSDIVFFANVLC